MNSKAPLKILQQMKKLEINDEIGRLFMIAWGLWNKMIKKVFENKLIHLEKAINQALSLLQDIKNQPDIIAKLSLNRTSWIAPTSDTLKLNVDGDILTQQQWAWVGCVLRNDIEAVIIVAINLEKCLNTPLKVEFLAIFRGLQLCVPFMIQTLIVGSNSLLALKAIKEEEESHAQHMALIKEITVLRKRFQECQFQ